MSKNNTYVSEFVRDGYVVIRNVVSRAVVDQIAKRTDDEYAYWKERMFPTETNSGGIFRPNWNELRAALQCIEQSGVVNDLLGETSECFATNVVLEPQKENRWPLGRMHIDRPPTTDPASQWPSFSLSVGIGIRGGNKTLSGSLGVFPGSHRACESFFRENPGKTLWECLTGYYHPTTERPVVDLPFATHSLPVEVLLEPGDIVCSHSLLSHTSMPNMTNTRRISSYFAFIHSRHSSLGNRFLRSIWDYFPQPIKECAHT